MTDNNMNKKRGLLHKLFKGLAIMAVVAVTLAVAAHLVWRSSGSGEWEREIDKKGVQIYSRKVPGSALKQFKGVTRVRTSLSRAIAAMTSTDTRDCAEWSPGCTSEKALAVWDPRKLTYMHLYRMKYPSPFAPREIVVQAKVTQNQVNKAVLIDFSAAPDALPHNDCCVRVEDMHNTWKFTPVGNGEVQVETVIDSDPELPYVLVNRATPPVLYRLLARLQPFLEKEKWQHARYETIIEQ